MRCVRSTRDSTTGRERRLVRRSLGDGGTLEEAVSKLEMQMIRSSLTRNNWNISRVANELGLTRRGLYLKLSRYGIEKAA